MSDIYKKNMVDKTDFGIDGEYALAYLLKNESSIVDEKVAIKKADVTNSLLGQVNYWLDYMNEYSLRGQFKNIDEFIETLRTSTLPALNKIQDEKGSILWKKDTFWELEICNGITILNIPQKRNERNIEKLTLRSEFLF